MNRTFDFDTQLRASEGVCATTPLETIKNMIPGCVQVEPMHELRGQLAGVDYSALLRGGAAVLIDHKARLEPCSQYWRNCEPELALEVWSVCRCWGENYMHNPINDRYVFAPSIHASQHPGCKVGWTLDESKVTDYTLHTFHPQDTDRAFLVPFQLLRKAFVNRITEWSDKFHVGSQITRRNGDSWMSHCVFVPWTIVLDAINEAMES